MPPRLQAHSPSSDILCVAWVEFYPIYSWRREWWSGLKNWVNAFSADAIKSPGDMFPLHVVMSYSVFGLFNPCSWLSLDEILKQFKVESGPWLTYPKETWLAKPWFISQHHNTSEGPFPQQILTVTFIISQESPKSIKITTEWVTNCYKLWCQMIPGSCFLLPISHLWANAASLNFILSIC